MPDTPEIVVTGDSWNSFNELDLLFPGYFNPGFYQDVAGPESVDAGGGGGGTSEAFAPPEPLLLPEVTVIGRAATSVAPPLWPIIGLIVPMNSGPPGTGDLPDGFNMATDQWRPPPEPPGGSTVGEDPIMPPNWEDIANEPFAPDGTPMPKLPWGQLIRWLADHLGNTPKPPGPLPVLDEFTVTPPAVETRSDPWPGPSIDLYLIPGSAFDLPISPFETSPDPSPEPAPDVVPNVDPTSVPGIEIVPTIAPDRGPGPAPTPTGTPGIDPVPGYPDPLTTPGPIAVPGPTGTPSPDPLGDPLPNPIGDPIGDPVAPPRQPEPVSAPPRTATGGTPSGFLDVIPIRDPIAGFDPLPQFLGAPVAPKKDTCKCDDGKKKEKKKRKEREVCYRGTYRQLRRGISYKQLEEVPCEAKAPREKTARKPRKKRTPSWNDTLDEVFGRKLF